MVWYKLRRKLMDDFSLFAQELWSRMDKEIIPAIQRVTIPMFLAREGSVELGTGVLYRIGGYHFVLTAAHNLHDFRKSGTTFFVRPNEGDPDCVVPLAGRFLSTELQTLDTGAIHLTDKVVSQITPFKSFIQNDRIASVVRPICS